MSSVEAPNATSSPRDTGYEGVAVLDLAQAPSGQGFMINPWTQPNSIFGIVDHPELPIALMRTNEIGAPLRRYLQVPGIEEDSRKLDRAVISRYYHSTRGEGSAILSPAELTVGSVAVFMEIDQDGEAVMTAENTISIEAIRMGIMQVAKPLVEGMVLGRI